MERWRVGHKVKLNVYEGRRPVCQCHSVEDAARIVAACNARALRLDDLLLDLGRRAREPGRGFIVDLRGRRRHIKGGKLVVMRLPEDSPKS